MHKLHHVSDLEEFLTGRWQLSRTIDDCRQAATTYVQGEIIITAKDDTILSYQETGQMQLAGRELRVQREYLIQLISAKYGQVLFTDQRLFHTLDLSAGYWQAEHDCIADNYQGVFRVFNPNQWHISWQIKGPRKDLQIASRLSRVL